MPLFLTFKHNIFIVNSDFLCVELLENEMKIKIFGFEEFEWETKQSRGQLNIFIDKM